MGKPIIATDAPGCRDAVEDGLTGFLCRAKDAGDLADKMAAFLALSPADRAEMGRRAREKMEREFDEKIVIARYCAALERLTVRDRSGMVSDVHHGS